MKFTGPFINIPAVVLRAGLIDDVIEKHPATVTFDTSNCAVSVSLINGGEQHARILRSQNGSGGIETALVFSLTIFRILTGEQHAALIRLLKDDGWKV